MTEGEPDRGQSPFDVSGHAQRVRRVVVNVGGRARTLGPLERVLWAFVALLAFLLTLVVLIPLLVLGGAVILGMLAYVSVRRALTNGRPAGRVADGRENVRVIRRDD